jgi:phospholipid/cholesterol/gamma-HCH transport system ATP-binding protein
VKLAGIRMAFGERVVFNHLSCQFPRGKISVILGGSGVGKSTILRLIGGLIQPNSGSIIVDGQDVTRLTERGLYEVRKKLGMLFQGGALLDSCDVFDNLALPLREQTKMSTAEIADEVHRVLAAVGVTDADNLLPGELSGGMLRRVALARAMIRKPTILLCDEPFSGLDPVSLRRIESLLVNVNRQLGMTLIVVSHDLPSTMRMADHAVLLVGDGCVQGSPRELHDSTNTEVAEFFNGDAPPERER